MMVTHRLKMSLLCAVVCICRCLETGYIALVLHLFGFEPGLVGFILLRILAEFNFLFFSSSMALLISCCFSFQLMSLMFSWLRSWPFPNLLC